MGSQREYYQEVAKPAQFAMRFGKRFFLCLTHTEHDEKAESCFQRLE
jgi:hypothetical protein